MNPEVDKKQLNEIISVIGDDFPKGYDLLVLFIQKEALRYANEILKELKTESK